MLVNILNLDGLDVIDVKDTESEYHVLTTPETVSRHCPRCGRSNI